MFRKILRVKEKNPLKSSNSTSFLTVTLFIYDYCFCMISSGKGMITGTEIGLVGKKI